MTVAELIERLKTIPQDARVVLQTDPECNHCYTVGSVDGDCLFFEHEKGGEVVQSNWSAIEAGFESAEYWEEFKKTGQRCCLLVPS